MTLTFKHLPKLLLTTSFALCLGFPFTSINSFGREDGLHDKAEMAKKAKVKIRRAIQSANEKVPGMVTKAELEIKHGPLMWEIEIVTDNGEVVEVHLNAEDGKIIDH